MPGRVFFRIDAGKIKVGANQLISKAAALARVLQENEIANPASRQIGGP
jgi:hypothetical protein